MASFYIRTDSAIIGPFTGVELREASLAGIVGPDSVISGTPTGSCYLALNIGLFSEKRIALPHPPDVQVPTYQVRGMSGAFQGPFKLRELVGFAVRGMLPTNALLQSTAAASDSTAQPWLPVERIPILSACLNGDLALIDSRGQVIRRAIQAKSAPVVVADARAPSEVAKNVDENDSTAFASTTTNTESQTDRAATGLSSTSRHRIGDAQDECPPSAITRALNSLGRRLSLPADFEFGLAVKRFVPVVAVMFVLASGAVAYLYWQNMPMSRAQVLGEWIDSSGSDTADFQPQFGIAFGEDGSCVIFNVNGDCWSGSFEWLARKDDGDGFETQQSLTTQTDEAEPNHVLDRVLPTDGLLRFGGRGDYSPDIDGHGVREVFVRREPSSLKLGYLTSVRFDKTGKSQDAAWVTLQQPKGLEPLDGGPDLLAESLSKVKASDLLATHGVPDEARRIYPFDLPGGKFNVEYANSQLIRYGKTKLVMNEAGLSRPDFLQTSK